MAKEKVMTGKTTITKKPSVKKNTQVDKVLVENFVSLQKVMTNLAVKFDNLSSQISKLLNLFEISAKSLAEKGYSEKERKVADKLDNLIEQNKVIAKGVALLHERGRVEEHLETMPAEQMPPQERPMQMPRMQIPTPQYSPAPQQPPAKSVMEMNEPGRQTQFLKKQQPQR